MYQCRYEAGEWWNTIEPEGGRSLVSQVACKTFSLGAYEAALRRAYATVPKSEPEPIPVKSEPAPEPVRTPDARWREPGSSSPCPKPYRMTEDGCQ